MLAVKTFVVGSFTENEDGTWSERDTERMDGLWEDGAVSRYVEKFAANLDDTGEVQARELDEDGEPRTYTFEIERTTTVYVKKG